MASVEIVTIGTEILLGHLVDTNSAYISLALADRGVDVYAKHSVGDNTERLAVMLADALDRADGVDYDRRSGTDGRRSDEGCGCEGRARRTSAPRTVAARARRTVSQSEPADE